MKPKAPKKPRMLDSAAVLAAWLAVIAAPAGPHVEATDNIIPFAYAAE